jgi:Ser/Thr protein kinase RdoA (MazF antagonist)
VGDDGPAAGFLHDAGLVLLPGEIRPREGRAWLVDWQGTRGVLRRLPAPAVSAASLVEEVAWLHAFLTRLAGLGFPSPRPLPCFDGRSWITTGGTLWEVVSFLPGHAVCWAAVPPMEEIGGLLGRYHTVVRQIEVTSQRPGALPLADVPAVLLSHEAVVPRSGQAIIRRLAAQLARDLDDAGHLIRERVVIHGDFTNDNVVADGTPPHATGVIDFANAHAETPLADIGYGLWRSGRPHEQADRLDFSRARRFLQGYASVVPVSPDQASVIAVYLWGRGLQMIAKRVRAGQNETGMLAQVQWLSANADAVADMLATALRESGPRASGGP